MVTEVKKIMPVVRGFEEEGGEPLDEELDESWEDEEADEFNLDEADSEN